MAALACSSLIPVTITPLARVACDPRPCHPFNGDRGVMTAHKLVATTNPSKLLQVRVHQPLLSASEGQCEPRANCAALQLNHAPPCDMFRLRWKFCRRRAEEWDEPVRG